MSGGCLLSPLYLVHNPHFTNEERKRRRVDLLWPGDVATNWLWWSLVCFWTRLWADVGTHGFIRRQWHLDTDVCRKLMKYEVVFCVANGPLKASVKQFSANQDSHPGVKRVLCPPTPVVPIEDVWCKHPLKVRTGSRRVCTLHLSLSTAVYHGVRLQEEFRGCWTASLSQRL